MTVAESHETLMREESDALAGRIETRFDERGYGLWAVERREDGAFLGFTGLAYQTFEAPFTPCVEVGWRLDKPAWGHGYATEAAREALRFGFEAVELDEIGFELRHPSKCATADADPGEDDARSPAPHLAEAVILVKPQFEADRGDVGKGGIVRDPEAHRLAIVKVADCTSSLGWQVVETIESPITGMEGNKEFLLYAKRPTGSSR